MSEIHGKGIVPDIEIELPEGVVPDLVLDEKVDTQLKKAIEHLTK
jgi:C-terminal processing protease CtpA/Prc